MINGNRMSERIDQRAVEGPFVPMRLAPRVRLIEYDILRKNILAVRIVFPSLKIFILFPIIIMKRN